MPGERAARAASGIEGVWSESRRAWPGATRAVLAGRRRRPGP